MNPRQVAAFFDNLGDKMVPVKSAEAVQLRDVLEQLDEVNGVRDKLLVEAQELSIKLFGECGHSTKTLTHLVYRCGANCGLEVIEKLVGRRPSMSRLPITQIVGES